MNKLHRIVARTCAAALLTTGVAVVASAPGASAATANGTSDITVYLTPPDPTGLDALARATGLSHDERLSRLEQLLPDPAPVAARLTSLGLTVTGEGPLSVSAHAPASTIASLFGTRPTLASLVGATLAQIRAAAGPLPLLPATLDGLVSAVMPDGGPATMHATPHAASGGVTYRGDQLRSAYAQPYDGSGSNPTIATIQFSSDPSLSSDLSTYAAQNQISNQGPLETTTVDTGPADSSGAAEVSLDQEAILAVSPTLKQRVYYAPNTNAGFAAAYQRVLTDVIAGRSDIVALSSSWGQCESQTPTALITTTDSIIKSLVAAGVTVFGATGDNGIYDCGAPAALTCPALCPAPTVDVDFPASSPWVVAVGATKLTQSSGGWSESAWSCTSGTISLFTTNPDCYATGGSGGGASGMSGVSGAFPGFPMPAYQSANIFSVPFKNSPYRLVPDVAAVGDPSTGLNAVIGGQNQAVGGTSLSTPVSAALFAGMLSHWGVQAGVGDVHNAIYVANHDARAPLYSRDIGQGGGTNGADADKRTDPSVSTGVGYDTVTGLGSIFWSALSSALITSTPTLEAKVETSGTTVIGTWKAGKTPNGAALANVSVNMTGPDGSSVASIPNAQANGVLQVNGIPGGNYTMFVTVSDTLGNRTTLTKRGSVPVGAGGGPAVVSTNGPSTLNIDDANFKGAGWTRVRMKGAFGGKVLSTSARGRRASVTVSAQTITLTFFAGPANGRLTVLVDGRKIVIDEYSKRSVRRSVTLLAAGAPGVHTIQILSTGSRNPRARGTTVDVDFLTAYLP